MSAPAGPDRRPAGDDVVEEAAQWLVRLSDTDADEAERARMRSAFEHWKTSDPRRATAAARIEGFVGRVQGLRAGTDSRPARAALDAAFRSGDKRVGRPRHAKRFAAALAIAAVLGMPGWLALRDYPPGYLMADLRGATGSWERVTLSDGTRVTLAGATAVDLRFDARRRAIELVRGEILVDVASDPARPFVVDTPHGSIRALGTRFVVRRDDDATVLTMLESRVAVFPVARSATDPDAGTVIAAGQQVRIGRDGLGVAEAIDPRSVSDAWAFHQLVVQDRPLPDVLDELARHRRGHILYDRAAIARHAVSAVLPLDDTDRALQLLATGFPIRVRTLTPWLVIVDAAPSARVSTPAPK